MPYIDSFDTPAAVKEVFKLISGGFFEIDAFNIVPGEPVRFNWRFHSFFDVSERRPWTLRVLVDGHVLQERTGVSLGHISTNVMTEAVTPPPHLANTIYKFGLHRLLLQLFEETASAPWRTGGRRFRVVPERVDETWWNWRSPLFASIGWKNGYDLIGDFINRSQYASMPLITAELSEVRSEDDPNINPCDYLPIQVKTNSPASPTVLPNTGAPFVFALKHEWSWFLPAAYLFTGPINKTFAYAIWFYFNDQFGNSYSGRCSARRFRHVGVSKGKKLAFSGAQAAALAAAAAGPFAFIYAGIMYAIASGLALIAKDPPEPDSFYREVAQLELPPEFALSERLTDAAAEARDFLCAILEAIALEGLRTKVRSRLLAARLMGDMDARDLQLREYERVEGEMRRSAERIGASWPKADQANAACIPADTRPVVYESFGEEGFPPGSARKMLDLGFSQTHIDGLTAILRNGEMREAASHRELQTVRTLAFAVLEMIEAFLFEGEAVRAGETYVRAASEDTHAEREVVRRSNRSSCS